MSYSPNAILKLGASICADFSESSTYKIGDYCLYNGEFYTATVEHAGAWDASHFTKTNAAEHLKDYNNVYGSIAPYYSATSTYEKGSIVSHENADNKMTIYSANQQIGTAETWTAAHWDEHTVSDFTGIDFVAPAYSSDVSNTYGDLVSLNRKLYRCKVAETSTPRSFKDTEWAETNSALETINEKHIVKNSDDANFYLTNGDTTVMVLELSNNVDVTGQLNAKNKTINLNGFTLTININPSASETQLTYLQNCKFYNGIVFINALPNSATITDDEIFNMCYFYSCRILLSASWATNISRTATEVTLLKGTVFCYNCNIEFTGDVSSVAKDFVVYKPSAAANVAYSSGNSITIANVTCAQALTACTNNIINSTISIISSVATSICGMRSTTDAIQSSAFNNRIFISANNATIENIFGATGNVFYSNINIDVSSSNTNCKILGGRNGSFVGCSFDINSHSGTALNVSGIENPIIAVYNLVKITNNDGANETFGILTCSDFNDCKNISFNNVEMSILDGSGYTRVRGMMLLNTSFEETSNIISNNNIEITVGNSTITSNIIGFGTTLNSGIVSNTTVKIISNATVGNLRGFMSPSKTYNCKVNIKNTGTVTNIYGIHLNNTMEDKSSTIQDCSVIIDSINADSLLGISTYSSTVKNCYIELHTNYSSATGKIRAIEEILNNASDPAEDYAGIICGNTIRVFFNGQYGADVIFINSNLCMSVSDNDVLLIPNNSTTISTATITFIKQASSSVSYANIHILVKGNVLHYVDDCKTTTLNLYGINIPNNTTTNANITDNILTWHKHRTTSATHKTWKTAISPTPAAAYHNIIVT